MSGEIKKPKYVRKYDYQQSYYRPKDEWFLPIQYVQDLLKSKTKYSTEEDEETSDDENEFDSYEFVKQNTSNFDPQDPKIFEGNKIDKDSKEFIIEKFHNIRNHFDFDKHKYLSNEEAQDKTISLLKDYNEIILFQPTFIYKDKAIAKPDALIKENDKIYLIETKGTTSTKAAHLVDIQYQTTIINDVLLKEFNTKITNFFLCLVEYRMGMKNEIGFVLTDCAAYQKGGHTFPDKHKNLEKFSDQYIFTRALYKEGKEKGLKFYDVIYNLDSIDLKAYNKFIENFSEINNEESFLERINEIYNTDINLNPSFIPCYEYKACWFKLNDYWLNIRDYFLTKHEYMPFHYSGKLFRYDKAMDLFKKNIIDENEINKLNIGTKAFGRYKTLINADNFKLGGFDANAKAHIENLKTKTKKVYFDFESINLATRVIDNTVPFMQTVNQVSVIFDKGDKILSESNNVLIDPLQLDLDSYKEIIDAIMPTSDLNECNQYIYIVYNKSFEVTRLEEMKRLFFINNKDYAKAYGEKVDVIVKNIFDLADFFNLESDRSIAIKKNHGFYSIKKVLPIIEELCPEIFNEVKCLDYKTLNQIQNGSQAQKESTKRFFNLVTDKEWDEISINLRIYCENDVRAMIATEYMLYKIIQP